MILNPVPQEIAPPLGTAGMYHVLQSDRSQHGWQDAEGNRVELFDVNPDGEQAYLQMRNRSGEVPFAYGAGGEVIVSKADGTGNYNTP